MNDQDNQQREGIEPAAAVEGAAIDRLLAGEKAALAERRRKALGAEAAAAIRTTVGLALSGGGVRSATFCLGLLRGLAVNGLLARIDYVSTVSGGGFTGGMLGRLVSAIGIHRAQRALSRGDSLVMWWLRRNGRYLTPAGSRDLGMALATYLRAWLAVQIEFATLALLAGVAVLLPHLAQNELGWFDAKAWAGWGSVWWPLAALFWMVAAPGTMLAYWAARDAADAPGSTSGRRAGPRVADWIGLLVLVLLIAWLVCETAVPKVVPSSAARLLLPVIGGLTARYASTLLRLSRASERSALGIARERNRLTRALRRCTTIAAGLAAIGFMDLASWHFAALVLGSESSDLGHRLVRVAGFAGVLLAALRVLAEPLQKLETSATANRIDWRSRLLNVAGFGLGLIALFAWISLAQWFVFVGELWGPLAKWSEPARALLLASLAGIRLLATGRNADSTNASSLHTFYRARLTRAWLSVGNPTRFPVHKMPPGAAGDVPAQVTADTIAAESALDRIHSVTEVLEGDDTSLQHYCPELNGGPIHLINACLNQTRDDSSDLYNADRKGCMITASARGFEWGRGSFHPLAEGDAFGTLGRWIAISGAAATPGAGSYTSSGWAMALFLLGVRLGYWLPRPPIAEETDPSAVENDRGSWRWRILTKPRLLLHEALARYGGLRQPWWYLSDGGHFENTGVYPLLRRRLDFIILADCGADARFELGDLENLIRKARIDFGAEIEFYTRDEASQRFSLAAGDLTVLSPEELAGNTSQRGVLLARVRYRDDGDGAKVGTLLVVKPNLHTELDADVLGYALRNPAFPQQSTGDQFFDEAQWESYQQLGFDFGNELRGHWLDRLPGWSTPAPEDATQLQRLRKPKPLAADAAAQAVPFWRRAVPAAALGTTLGIGASSTFLLAGWQAFDQFRTQQETYRKDRDSAIDEAEHYLDSAKGISEANGQLARPLTRHARVLVGLRGSAMDDHTLTRYEAVVDAYKRHCSIVDEKERATSLRGSLCGVPQKTEPARPDYWNPTCTSRYPRPFDLRACSWAPEIRNVAEATDPPLALAEITLPGVPTPPSAAQAAEQCLRAGVSIYVHVYEDATREAFEERLKALQLTDDARKRFLPVENVVLSAARRGSRAPYRWPRATLLVHSPDDRECAESIVKELGPALFEAGGEVGIQPLPKFLKATPKVIELWLPPGSVASRAPVQAAKS